MKVESNKVSITDQSSGMDALHNVSNISSIYQKGNVKLLNIDCVEFMKTLPDNYFDLAIPDPAYMNKFNSEMWGKDEGKIGKHRFKTHLLTDNKPNEEYFKELFRVSKYQIIWGGNYFTTYLPESRCWICWNKEQTGKNFSDFELAWTNFDKVSKMIKFRWNGMLQENMKDKEEKIHPSQKPVGLYARIYNEFATKEMKCLDTHGGSFSSAIAGYYFGFSEFVACELNTEMYQLSVKRFKEKTLAQLIDFNCC